MRFMTRVKKRTAKLISSTVLGVLLNVFAVSAQDRPECFEELAYALTDDGTYVYIEDTPNGQNSGGRLELRENGQTQWSISTARGCSLGISICNLTIDYTLDDGSVGNIDFDMSYGRVKTAGGEAVCVMVMSQMGEQLAYLHRRFQDDTVTFARGRSDAPTIKMNEYLRPVPNVFQKCRCSSTTS